MLALVVPSQSCDHSLEYLPVRYSCLLLLICPKKLNLNLKTKPNSHLAQQRICRTISLSALEDGNKQCQRGWIAHHLHCAIDCSKLFASDRTSSCT